MCIRDSFPSVLVLTALGLLRACCRFAAARRCLRILVILYYLATRQGEQTANRISAVWLRRRSLRRRWSHYPPSFKRAPHTNWKARVSTKFSFNQFKCFVVISGKQRPHESSGQLLISRMSFIWLVLLPLCLAKSIACCMITWHKTGAAWNCSNRINAWLLYRMW